MSLRHELEDFYYREAELLDTGQYEQWLQLFTADVRYYIPIQEDRMAGDPRAQGDGGESCYCDDNRWSLELRVRQRLSDKHWCENPRSRLRHFVTNLRVRESSGEAIETRTYSLVYRNRIGNTADLWSCEREDSLLPSDGGFKIRRRRVVLDQSVLLSKNLSVFL